MHIEPHGTRFDFLRNSLAALQVGAPDAGSQTKSAVVSSAYGLGLATKALQRQDWTKGFLMQDRVGWIFDFKQTG